MATIGHVIRRLREQRNWTQGQLSTYSGVDQSYISRIERDQHEHISFKVLALLATALTVSLDSIAIEAGLLPELDNLIWSQPLRIMQRAINLYPVGSPEREHIERIIIAQAEAYLQFKEGAEEDESNL